MKVVITDHPFKSLDITQRIFSSNGLEFDVLQTKDPEVIIEKAGSSEAILVGKANIDENILKHLKKCKLIVQLGTGYDNIDVKAATKHGIPVCNIPDFCMDEVSDHAMALVLAAGRKIVQGNTMVQAGQWRPVTFGMDSVCKMRGRVLGLFGLGRISVLTATKAQGFGMQCVAFDPFVSAEKMLEIGIKKVDIDGLLAESDFITLHTPLTEETLHSFNLDRFRAMKRSAWIINTSRGEIIQQEDLAKALDEKLIGGAALDVLDKEPPTKDHPLLHRDNVILTPHMGWMSDQAPDSMQQRGAEQVVRVLKGELPTAVVNPEVLK